MESTNSGEANNHTSTEAAHPKEEVPNIQIVYKERDLYAGFWIRLWAYLLDLVIVGSLNRIAIVPLFTFLEIPTDSLGFFSPFVISTTMLAFLYFVIMTKIFQQTLGKMVFGLKVYHVNENQQLSWVDLIFREIIGKFISKTVLFLGFLAVAFSKKKQGWHDKVADTIVRIER